MAKSKRTKEDLIHEIRKYWDHKGLYDLWMRVCKENKPSSFWSSGKALEHIIIRAFEIEGAEVKYPFEVSYDNKIVEQIDGAIFVNGLSVLSECKDYAKGKIDIEPIAKLRNQLLRRPNGVIGSVFSMTEFTEPMKILSSYVYGPIILLWSVEEIEYCLKYRCFTKALVAKYRQAVAFANYAFRYDIAKKYD